MWHWKEANIKYHTLERPIIYFLLQILFHFSVQTLLSRHAQNEHHIFNRINRGKSFLLSSSRHLPFCWVYCHFHGILVCGFSVMCLMHVVWGVLCNVVGFCCVIFLSFFFKFENKTGFEGVRPSLVISFLTFMCMAIIFVFVFHFRFVLLLPLFYFFV